MNIDSLLKERKDLEAHLVRLNRVIGNIHFLREGYGGSTSPLLSTNPALVFKEIEYTMRQAVLDCIAMAEHRLSEIEETLTAINTLLNGGSK
jgi:hypothetical protein